MTDLRLRRAVPADIPVILEFLHDLAVYQKEPEALKATPELIRRHYFEEGAPVTCLVAERSGEAVGMLTCCESFSGFKSKPLLYVDCLIIRETARGTGVGRALIAEASKIAEERGCCRVELNVYDWNEAAQAAYRRSGFEDAGLRTYCLTPDRYSIARG
ncbi:MAG: GNAT family N-acetyltransferase [Alphaproteobacteria bacterium]|nr:GNAT family N-acetyltransferase [Alphaproteobacteria bacterium]